MAQSADQQRKLKRANEVLNRLIANEKQAVRYYTLFALVLLAAGIGLIIVAYLSSHSLFADGFNRLLGISGAFISALSTIPINQLLDRRARIGMLEIVRGWLPVVESQNAEESDATHDRILESLMKVVDQTILGKN